MNRIMILLALVGLVMLPGCDPQPEPKPDVDFNMHLSSLESTLSLTIRSRAKTPEEAIEEAISYLKSKKTPIINPEKPLPEPMPTDGK